MTGPGTLGGAITYSELMARKQAILDIQTRPDLELTEEERQVKQVEQGLLSKPTADLLVLDWRKRQQARAEVRVFIDDALYGYLPDKYSDELRNEKRDAVYRYVYDNYSGGGISVYWIASSRGS